MAEPTDQTVVRPEVMMLEGLLDEIAAGRLRVPRFQRPFVWGPEQMLELFDSIERGYPIGSILVWETTADVPSLEVLAGIPIPAPPSGGTVSYLLDGHQRLSTLFGALGNQEPAPGAYRGDWEIYRRLGESDHKGIRFQHWHRGGEPPGGLLPLTSVLRTMDFLGFARRLARNPDIADPDALVDEAEAFAMRIKSYKIAVIRLTGGSLSHAVEAFARLNSGGRQITPYEMVSALTYRPDRSHTFADRLLDIGQGTAVGGFGVFDLELIFRTVVALSGTDDVEDLRWADFAADVDTRLDDLAVRADAALTRTVEFLRYEAGVPDATLLPYPLQMLLLAIFFDRVPYPQRHEIRTLVRWFWATSWGGGLTSSRSMEFTAALHDMRYGVPEHTSVSSIGQVQPMPTDFERDDGRLRAYLVWEMREFPQRVGIDGEPIDMTALPGRAVLSGYNPIMKGGSNGPENWLMIPRRFRTYLGTTLRELPAKQLRRVVVSHGIPADALAHLMAGNAPAFLRARRAFLAERERAFMHEMGVEPSPLDAPDGHDA